MDVRIRMVFGFIRIVWRYDESDRRVIRDTRVIRAIIIIRVIQVRSK
jgi:hypothetical protein